jgi:hypothetical protein
MPSKRSFPYSQIVALNARTPLESQTAAAIKKTIDGPEYSKKRGTPDNV